jgi:hypothetical protein
MGTVLLTVVLLIAGFAVALALGMHGEARAFEHGRNPTHDPEDEEDRR